MADFGMIETVLAVSFVLALILLISPRLRRSAWWAPMVTPLASIIGSGFMVSVPLLAAHLGSWAIAAMAGLCLLAYALGGAIRFNIAQAEPLLAAGQLNGVAGRLERASHGVLAVAYFISVAYYLALLGAFLLKIAGVGHPRIGTAIASAVVIGICVTGITRGLSGVEGVEKYSVGTKMAAILALLLVLALFWGGLPTGWWRDLPSPIDGEIGGWDRLRFLMGLLIVVQGFETSRFMGHLYDAPTRIASMRRAQIMAGAVYIAFFLLMLPLFGAFTEPTDVAGFIEVIGIVSPWLPPLMVLAAVASEFSAAVADSIGASGLAEGLSGGQISEAKAYWLIGAVALAVLWLTDVVGLVALASRAFALFYALQCAVATLIAYRQRRRGRMVWYGFLALICLATAGLGLPAEA